MVTSIKSVLFFALLSVFASYAESKRMVCYFGSWSVYRPGAGKFDVENIDPHLCTHVIFGFVGLSEAPGIKVLDPWNELYDDWGKGAFTRFVNLKKLNPSLKVLVAIGGWNEGSIKYSQAFKTAASRNVFVHNALGFVQKYGFDGLDLDWEYPGQRGGDETDKRDFTELIKALREEFDKHGLLVTAAVAAAEFSFMQSYEVEALGKYLHFINVMTYDMHGAWEKVTGHNAPLFGAEVEKGTDHEGLNVDSSIKAWIQYGAPADKLVMGVGMYGRSFTLASPRCTQPRCASLGGGWAGPWTRESGILGYYEICLMERESGTMLEFDNEALVPYLVKGNQWVGYDNKKSIQLKVDYILHNNLGGAMTWSVDTDDFTGACGQGRFPLLSLLSKGVLSGVPSGPLPTPAPPSSTNPPITLPPEGITSGRMVCYFGSWSVYRPGAGKFDVEDIDPSLCTHLIFGFVGLSSEPGIRVLDPWNELYDDYGKGAFNRFVNLKYRSPGLKVLVAIGGWNEGSIKYSEAFATAEKRKIFVDNSVKFLRKYGFDGLDLDWEYPAQRGGLPSDKEAFSALIKELRQEYDKYGYLLTAAVAAAEFSMSQSYEVKALAEHLHFINVMTYDMHGAWEKITGHNAPLFPSEAEFGTEHEQLNIDSSIKTWLNYGAPPEKLVMGVGMYGRTFTLASTTCAEPRCPNVGGGNAGPWTRETGILGYYEICKLESDPLARKAWDNEAKVPYIVKGNQWIGYDNMKSVQMKIDYILEMKLGGAMIWSVDTDDYSGACGRGRYPLLSLLKKGVTYGNNTGSIGSTTPSPTKPTEIPTEPTENPTEPTENPTEPTEIPTEPTENPTEPTENPTEPTEIPTEPTEIPTEPTEIPTESTDEPIETTTEPAEIENPEPVPESPCTRSGYIRDKDDCKVFYLCRLVSEGVYAFSRFVCSSNLVFDTTRNVCNYPNLVDCSLKD